MRALLAIAGLALGLAGLAAKANTAAVAQPSALLSGITHQAFFGIAVDGNTVYAVGAGGDIQRSADAGKTWSREAAPNPLSLLAVAARGGHAIAVGQMGTILVRGEDGQWTPADAGGTQERLLAVSINSKGEAVISGSFGTILVSGDAGKTWRSTTVDWAATFAAQADELGDSFAPHLYAAQIDEAGVITLAGEVGVVVRSTDAGASWTMLHHGTKPSEPGGESLFALDLRDDGKGFAVGQSGTVLTTFDAGKTWYRLKPGTDANLLGVASRPSGEVVIAGMRTMITSRDGGRSWDLVKSGDVQTGWYSGVALEGSRGALAAGHTGRVIKVTP